MKWFLLCITEKGRKDLSCYQLSLQNNQEVCCHVSLKARLGSWDMAWTRHEHGTNTARSWHCFQLSPSFALHHLVPTRSAGWRFQWGKGQQVSCNLRGCSVRAMQHSPASMLYWKYFGSSLCFKASALVLLLWFCPVLISTVSIEVKSFSGAAGNSFPWLSWLNCSEDECDVKSRPAPTAWEPLTHTTAAGHATPVRAPSAISP